MRFTIERMRTLVLAAGILLVGTLAGFLAVGKWRNPLNLKELPRHLGVGIQQDAGGYTLEHAFGAHSRYRIHASKVVEFRQGKAMLHEVRIELFDEDGSRVDRIEGNEFEYDRSKGTATASGPVEITLMKPGAAPGSPRQAPKATPGQALGVKAKSGALALAAESAAEGEIHIKTSGLVFDQNSGVASTDEHVEFSMAQGSGSSMGASYDSKQGYLVLDRAVELTTERGSQTVQIHAEHAEFERDAKVCRLHGVTASEKGGEAAAGDAKVLFREDGSALRLDALNGFTLSTADGGHVSAPRGWMDFNERNQPRRGFLEGGVKMDSASHKGSQTQRMKGSSPQAEFDFTARGELRHVHLERGVELNSEEVSQLKGAAGPLLTSRNWRSPVDDVEFRDNGRGQAEPATIHGTDGVVVTGRSQRGKGAAVPSRLAADEVTGTFGPTSILTAMIGTGHASMGETTATGDVETVSGERLEAHFASVAKGGPGGADQIQRAELDGHVVLTEEPAAKPGAAAQAPLRATAGRAVYEGVGEWLHLSLSPRVEDGPLQLTAEKIDVAQQSGEAFAHGDVKATWSEAQPSQRETAAQGNLALGGQGPAHVVSAEAELRQANGEATFRGHARMWQQGNSVSAPVIVLDRQKQTLVARSTNASEPVRAVLVSAAGPQAGTASGAGKGPGSKPRREADGKTEAPSVIRVRGGDLKYSAAERKATMRGGGLGAVTAETGTATTVCDELVLLLLPPGNHAGKDGGASSVDRMTARGHVSVASEGRRGTGEQLVYSGETGEYVLTGTAAALPEMSDPARGTVTGEALIFNSRNDSVSVEGGGRETTTETTAPK